MESTTPPIPSSRRNDNVSTISRTMRLITGRSYPFSKDTAKPREAKVRKPGTTFTVSDAELQALHEALMQDDPTGELLDFCDYLLGTVELMTQNLVQNQYWSGDSLSEVYKMQDFLFSVLSEVISSAVEPQFWERRMKTFELVRALARVDLVLGFYKDAGYLYKLLCPQGSSTVSSGANFNAYFVEDIDKHKQMVLLEYFRVLIIIEKDPGIAESIGRAFLLAPAVAIFSEDNTRKIELILGLNQLANNERNYKVAAEHLDFLAEFYPEVFGKDLQSGIYCIHKAVTLTGMDDRLRAEPQFVRAIATSAVVNGLWDLETLDYLLYYGKALIEWGNYKAALVILEECCLGKLYRLGRRHPSFKEAYRRLKATEGSDLSLERLQDFARAMPDPQHRNSTAWKHIHVNTIVDLFILAGIPMVSEYENRLGQIIRAVTNTTKSTGARYRGLRARARYLAAEGSFKEALDAITLGNYNDIDLGDRVILSLDRVSYHHKEHPHRGPELSKVIFIGLRDRDLLVYELQGLHNQLVEMGLTHFTRDLVSSNPPLITKRSPEAVGMGAYSIVESIKAGNKLYACKSIPLPRYNQTQVRRVIQNEISVVRRLLHPHIIWIYFTYEDKSRFSIVMEPLADCDLEAFLANNRLSKKEVKEFAWKWMRCLANTLAFIHSKNIRHKDIKTRNILVKNGNVIFADFGSSHAFLDESNSATTGPSYGHTVMYCAPEVIKGEQRNRSSDVFSLGCVFTEIITWLGGRSISDYYEFRKIETEEGAVTHAYHATQEQLFFWFDELDESRVRGGSEVSKLFYDVVEKMMASQPGDRMTALDTATATGECYFYLNQEPLESCTEFCHLRLKLDRTYEKPDPNDGWLMD